MVSDEPTSGASPEAEPPPPPPPPEALGDEPAAARGGVRWGLVLLVVGLVAALLVAAGAATLLAVGSEGSASGGSSERAEAPVEEAGPRDAAVLELLERVDASEQAMLEAQDELSASLAGLGQQEGAEVAAAVSDAAEGGRAALADTREPLAAHVDGLDHPRARDVGEVYLEHHDAWADYFARIAEEPGLVVDEDRHAQLLVPINATAEEFATDLRALLDEGDVSREVVERGEEILQRGFSADVSPQT